MLEMLLVCSAIILVVMGLRLLFRRKVSGLLVYSLWLPAAAGLLLAPVVYLLAGAFSDLAAFAINNAPVIYLTGLLWLAGAEERDKRSGNAVRGGDAGLRGKSKRNRLLSYRQRGSRKRVLLYA